MPNLVFIATSLDGYIADKDGGLDWLSALAPPNTQAGEAADYGYHDFIRRVDAIVMGRHTFDFVRTIDPWPYDKPLFVLCHGLAPIPSALKKSVKTIHGPAARAHQTLTAQGFKNIYIDGGITIQSFLAADLIDEMIISVLPIVLGGGAPLFAPLNAPLTLAHTDTKVFSNGLVQNHYRRTRDSDESR